MSKNVVDTRLLVKQDYVVYLMFELYAVIVLKLKPRWPDNSLCGFIINLQGLHNKPKN